MFQYEIGIKAILPLQWRSIDIFIDNRVLVLILNIIYVMKDSYVYMGSRDGAVVRALASHQCGPGSIPGLGVICGLSLLLVLFSAPRGFSPGTPVFPSPQKPTLSKFQFDPDTVDGKSHYVDVHC